MAFVDGNSSFSSTTVMLNSSLVGVSTFEEFFMVRLSFQNFLSSLFDSDLTFDKSTLSDDFEPGWNLTVIYKKNCNVRLVLNPSHLITL